MANPITWWEVYGKDGKKLQKFYADLFGWQVDTSNPMNYGMVDTHDSKGIDGGIAESDQGAQVMIYVEVDDIQAYLDKAMQMGGRLVVPATVIPDQLTYAQFADIEGNVIGLIKNEAR